MSALSAAPRGVAHPGAASRTLPRAWAWWPLALLLVLAAALRFSTLDLQSFWYDEAFTPVHVLHASLPATLRSMVHSENSPPLWYLIAWADVRVFGDGEIALRMPSALAGAATVAVGWGIGRELGGRRCALACAALLAANPLFVWYSQEARVYALFALTIALAMLFCLRAARQPTRGRLGAFVLASALALLTHYFSVFLLAGMALWLLRDRASRRAVLAACGGLAVVALALLPLLIAQGGHGTQWIGRWALSSRLQTIPQYYLTGYSGSPLGHGIELLVALPILAAIALALLRADAAGARRGGVPSGQAARAPLRVDAPPGWSALGPAAPPLLIAACGIFIPLVLALAGADYLAPRNLIAAMVPVTGAIAVLMSSPAAGRWGLALLAIAVAAFLAISIDVDLSPRLQRGDWRGLARALGPGAPTRVLTTVELGGAPLQYYLPALRTLPANEEVLADEVVETGYAPLRSSAGSPPAPGFVRAGRLDVNGLIAYRFRAAQPRPLTESLLRRRVITLAHPEVLVSRDAYVTSAGSRG